MPLIPEYPKGENIITEGGVTFERTNLAEGLLFRIALDMKEGMNNGLERWGDYVMLTMKGGYIAMGLTDKSEALLKYSEFESAITQNPENLSLPRPCSVFEMNGLGFVLLKSRSQLNENTDDFRYKGVILNTTSPSLGDKNISSVEEEMKGRSSGLLGQ